MDKKPEIYKSKIANLKNKVQNEYYFHNNTDKSDFVFHDKSLILEKIKSLFNKNDYIYKITTNIVLKNKKVISKNIIGFKEGYLICLDGEKINIDDIYDIKK